MSIISGHCIGVLGEEDMDQTIDCIRIARQNPEEMKIVMDSLSKDCPSEIIVDRFRLGFNPQSDIVTITRVSDGVPGASKINGFRVSYRTMRKLLNWDFEDMEGFEWV